MNCCEYRLNDHSIIENEKYRKPTAIPKTEKNKKYRHYTLETVKRNKIKEHSMTLAMPILISHVLCCDVGSTLLEWWDFFGSRAFPTKLA